MCLGIRSIAKFKVACTLARTEIACLVTRNMCTAIIGSLAAFAEGTSDELAF